MSASLPPPDPQTPKTLPLSNAEYALRAARYLITKTEESPRLVSCLDAGLEYLATLERDLSLASAKLEQMEKALKEAEDNLRLAEGYFQQHGYALSAKEMQMYANAASAALASSLNTEKKP